MCNRKPVISFWRLLRGRAIVGADGGDVSANRGAFPPRLRAPGAAVAFDFVEKLFDHF
jgi:hypothetical protein